MYSVHINKLSLLQAQQSVWVAQKLEPKNPCFNCGGYLELQGEIEVAIFESALLKVVAETDALRTQFIEEETGEVWQTVKPNHLKPFPFHYMDLTQNPDSAQIAETFMRDDLAKPVDIIRGPLFNQVLFKLKENLFFFYLRYHHIVMDGFSQILYWRRVAEIYSALLEKECTGDSPFKTLELLLKEETNYYNSERFKRDQKFWTQKLDNYNQDQSQQFVGDIPLISRGLLRRFISLDERTIDQLMGVADKFKTRWTTIVIAAMAAYTHQLTGQENIAFILPVTARMTPDAQFIPSMLANQLPLQLTVQAHMSIDELIRHVSKQVAELLSHQLYRSESQHHKSGLSPARQKIIGPTLNIISFDQEIRFSNISGIAHHLSSGPVTDIVIGFYRNAGASGFQIYFDANPERYTMEELSDYQKRFMQYFEKMNRASTGMVINEIDIIFEQEQQTLQMFNATDRAYDLSKCLHELIDEQAKLNPDQIAISTAEKSITYKVLVSQANCLARYLQQQGVKSGDLVGVYQLRSLEMIISLLAILKAGAAYVPLDPELPRQRIIFQLQNADIHIVFSNSKLQDQYADFGIPVHNVDSLIATLPIVDTQLIPCATSENIAYIIYTSGSTGQPKGVMVPHRGIVNRLLWMQDEYRLKSDDCVLQKTPFTFDVSVWEFFWPLLAGARLFLANPGGHRDPRYIAQVMASQNITTVHFVPSMLDLFLAEPTLADLKKLRRVICSGEALDPHTVDTFFKVFKQKQDTISLYNLYGPTEASVDVTAWKCSHKDVSKEIIPIGYPIANTHIYILNPNGKQLPIGKIGELYIGGKQVAVGYLNRTDLTEKSFLANHFIDGKMYRTGDLARYRQDGAIEFLGRIDQQAKIRGFRIELGEIENHLRRHPSIKQAVLSISDTEEGSRKIIAYVIFKKNNLATENDLKIFLATHLPEYMIPEYIVKVRKFSLLSNGKLDRHALPKPKKLSHQKPVLAKTEDEQILYQVWCDVLGRKDFGSDQSFFALGGDSMLSIRLRTMLEKNGRTFDLQDLFYFSTFQQLVQRLRPFSRKELQETITRPFSLLSQDDIAKLPAGLADAYPLSAMQAGMLFQAELNPESSEYRVVTSLHLEAVFDEFKFRQAIQNTCRRHPALRSGFDISHYSEPLQLVYSRIELELEVLDNLIDLNSEDQQKALQTWTNSVKNQCFDLKKPPLIKFFVHRRSSASFQFSVVEHHVVLDGWSDMVMLDEIIMNYRAKLAGEELWLPEIGSTYRDFIATEKKIVLDNAAQMFWRGLLDNLTPTLLPRQNNKLSGEKSIAAHQTFAVPLPEELVLQLNDLARQYSLPLKTLLITAHVSVLQVISNSM